jgi:two-component system KDP operon response regulator KdpE
MDGIEVIRALRCSVATPIIVFSSRATELDKLAAIEAGASDYVTKSSLMSDLRSRVHGILDMEDVDTTLDKATLTFGDLQVDVADRQVHIGDRTVDLTPSEFRLLLVLARNAGKLLTVRNLAREMWDSEEEVYAGSLKVVMTSLRRKIEVDLLHPRHVMAEVGVGYRLVVT